MRETESKKLHSFAVLSVFVFDVRAYLVWIYPRQPDFGAGPSFFVDIS